MFLLIQPGRNLLAAGGQLSSSANRIVSLRIDLSLGQEESSEMIPNLLPSLLWSTGVLSLQAALSCWTSSPLASIAAHSSQGGADESRQNFERRKIYLVVSISASIFLNCNLWFFWRSNKIHFANCVRLSGSSIKIWNENSPVIELRAGFFVMSAVWLVAKHPQTGNIPQWFSQKPCKNLLSSLLITQA